MKSIRVVTVNRIIWAVIVIVASLAIVFCISLFNKKKNENPDKPNEIIESKIIDYTNEKETIIEFSGITLDDNTLVDNDKITIKESATYKLTGNNDKYKIVVDAPNSVVKIKMANFFTSIAENLINVKNAKKVIFELEQETINEVTSTISDDSYVITSNVDVDFIGTGKLIVNSTNKFLNAKTNINITDSTIELNDMSTGIIVDGNMKLNSGTIYNNSTDLGILCNGNLEIENGLLISISTQDKPLSINGIFLINKGEVFAAGLEEIQKPNANSLQKTVLFNFAEKTSKILIIHDTQNIPMAYEAKSEYQHVLYSSPVLKEQNYILYAGGKISGEKIYNLYRPTDYMEDYQLTASELTNDYFNLNELINVFDGIVKK